jgi:DNA polymerase-3 subunit delta'
VTFSGIIGLEKPLSVIGRMLTSGRIPHALLFHGPEGVGKRTVAERLAISLLCERPGADGAACGSCAACVKAAHGNHPDLLVTTRLPKAEPKGGTEPDDETEGEGSGDLKAWIVVDQVRELAQHAAYAPREGRRRVFLVDPADRMNAAAQNALLKTLEEPPGRALIILISARPHVLFPTVRSRCSQLGFAAMEPDRLAAALAAHGLAAGEARSRAALAEGRPGRALALDPEATARRRDAILELLDGLVASPAALAGMPDYVDEILGDGEPATSEGLELATSLLRDAARTAAGLRSILNADVAPRVARLGRALGADRAGELAELADRLRGDLRLNVNRTLLAESFLAAVAGGPSPE